MNKNKTKFFLLFIVQLMILSSFSFFITQPQKVFAKSVIINGQKEDSKNKKDLKNNDKYEKKESDYEVTITMPKDKDGFYDNTKLYIYDITNIHNNNKHLLDKMTASDYIKFLLKSANNNYTENKYLSIVTNDGIAQVNLDAKKAYYIIDENNFIKESIIIPSLEFSGKKKVDVFPKLKGYYSEYERKRPKKEPPKTPENPPTPQIPNIEIPKDEEKKVPNPVTPVIEKKPTPTPTEKVKTGDESKTYLAQTFIVSAGVLLLLMFISKNKSKKNKKY